MYAGAIEATAVPQNPIDVLAQQLVAMAAVEDFDVDDTFVVVRRAMPYRKLTRETFEAVLDMLSGRYPSDDFAELRPRVVWDRSLGTVSARSNARLLAVTNPGTIPDRGLYTVNLPDGARVGELDEEMVYESRPGDSFVLGSTTWRIDDISHDRVTVTPAPATAAGKMPFWHGDAPGRPVELGRAVGAFTRRIGGMDVDEATKVLKDEYRLDDLAAGNLATFILDEREFTGVLPTDRSIVVQRFRDEIGDWRIVVLSPFGGRVHAPWALAIRNRYRTETGGSVDVIWSDDGIVLRFPDVDNPPDTDIVAVDTTTVEDTIIDEVADSALFTSKFREAAARALLLPRRRPGTRTPLWLQRRRAANLLEVTKDFGSFPVMLETYREVLQDHFDVPALIEVLTDIDKRVTRVSEVDTQGPSPFASSLMFDFIASFMYEYDAPVAEKRIAALSLDRSLLADLLGEPEFRDLLDPEVIDAVEADLQHLSEDRRARSLDATHDLLRDLGPLTLGDIRVRVEDPHKAEPWLADLTQSGRVYEHALGDRSVFIAAEDLARLRDAVGIQPRPGVPTDLLEPVQDPLGDVVHRFARTHGPFTTEEAAHGTDLSVAATAEVLARLERNGKLRAGAYRPGGTEREWVSVDVLRRLRRRSLAALRQQVEAVEPSRYAAFLPGWQSIANPPKRRPVLEIVRQLAGAPLIASSLDDPLLSSRSPTAPEDLDTAMANGEVVWIGIEALGTRDGRIALLPRDTASHLMLTPQEEAPDDVLHRAIIEHLASFGASFFVDVYHGVGGGSPDELTEAIWDLVWAGVVTNDSISPLRGYTARRRRRKPAMPHVVAVPLHGTGRWYLTERLRTPAVSAEERTLTLAHTLLDRYGVVTRDVVLAEGIAGGFSGLYPAFSSLEDIGTVRRGYFVEGMGGAQFALPGAVERLRHQDAPGMAVFAATDPAQAYGASVAWPGTVAKVERRAGALVAMAEGSPVAWLDPAGRRVVTFGSDEAKSVGAIEMLSKAHGKVSIATIDESPAHEHALAPALLAAGFLSGYKGFTVRPTPANTRS